ncbi:hypothetical protein MAR_030559 [Mya arenaria]|uniref:Uncharacterized protein n=1 Tax=Mya arenaria TaxID=6604 RepID=A0ABY7F1A7_MYAAR|nr:hypothetical protein MAR_030559 [Mya arenaria]
MDTSANYANQTAVTNTLKKLLLIL